MKSIVGIVIFVFGLLSVQDALAAGAARNWLEFASPPATVTTGNSGAGSGTAFDNVTIGAGASVTFDVLAAHGASGIKMATGATAAQASVDWSTTIGTSTSHYGRLALYVTAYPSSNTRIFTAFSGSTLRGSIQLGSNGKLRTFDATNSLIATTSGTIPLSTWIRVEWYFVGNASTGRFDMKYFASLDAAAPTETASNGSLNTGGPVDTYRFGTTTNISNLTLNYDDLAVSQSAYPGPANYASAVLSDSPVGYWRLGEPSGGFAADSSSGGSHPGSYQNGPTLGATGALPHDGNTSVTFDGVNDYVQIADHPAFSRPSSGAITIEAWMRADSLEMPDQEGSCLNQRKPGYVMWLGKGQSSPNQYEWGFRMYQVQLSPPVDNCEMRYNRVSFYSFNLTGGEGNGSYIIADHSIVVGAWNHFVGVINQTEVKIYWNGELRDHDLLDQSGTGGLTISPQDGSAPVRLGTRDGTNSFLKGGLDEVAIYATELSAEQILSHYDGR